MVIELTLLRLLEHVRRQVDPGQRPGERAQLRPKETGAATQAVGAVAVDRDPEQAFVAVYFDRHCRQGHELSTLAEVGLATPD